MKNTVLRYAVLFVTSFVISMLVITAAGFVLDERKFGYALGMLDLEKEQAAVTETLEFFNQMFMDVYASGGSSLLLDQIPADTEMRHRMFKDVGYMKQNGVVLVHDSATFEVESVKINGPDTAEAIISDEWNYQFKDIRTRKAVSDLSGSGGKFRYELAYRGGGWIVTGYAPVFEQ